jgi:hypothetical protein
LRPYFKRCVCRFIDSLYEHKSTEEKLLEGLGSQCEALVTVHEMHSDILILHSSQDLVSLATIRAVDIFKLDFDRVKTSLDLMYGLEESANSTFAPHSDSNDEKLDSIGLGRQMAQNDVDSLFA